MLWTGGLDLAPFKPEGDPKVSEHSRPALNPYSEFSLFPPPLQERGWCKFASYIHFLLLCSKQKTTTTPPCTHALLSLLMNHFTHLQIFLSQPHPHLTSSHSQRATSKAQSWLAISWDRLSQEFPASGSARHTATTDALAVFWHLRSLFRPRPKNASEKNTF